LENGILCEKNGFVLRLAEADDAENYYLQNYCPLDREIARLTGSKESFSKREVVSFFRKSICDGSRRFFIIVSPDGRIMGESVINEIDFGRRCANFRICIFDKRYLGRGIGAWAAEAVRDYAFAELKLHRLELNVFSFNVRAQKAYLKTGFKIEGVLRESVADGEGYADNILMAILEDEWKALKNRAVSD
jgi:hypothetical protein